jgi:hypothetical protein
MNWHPVWSMQGWKEIRGDEFFSMPELESHRK